MAGLGIPVKLLHEGIGHTVTCELKTGVFRSCWSLFVLTAQSTQADYVIFWMCRLLPLLIMNNFSVCIVSSMHRRNVPWTFDELRRQHECDAGGRHSNWKGWQGSQVTLPTKCFINFIQTSHSYSRLSLVKGRYFCSSPHSFTPNLSWEVTNLEQVYLRGSQIRYFILPDMLRHAPMFKKKGRGAGRGVYGVPGKGRGKGLATRARTAAAATRKWAAHGFVRSFEYGLRPLL